MRHLFFSIVFATVTATAAVPFFVGARHWPFHWRSPSAHDHANGPKPKPGAHFVPEFDPAAAGAIAALLAGGGVLIASRRKR